jgi:two-component system sensor histidine kinase VicK
MKIFSSDNFIIITTGTLLGLFAGLVVFRFYVDSHFGGAILTVILILLVLLGLFISYSFTLNKFISRYKYEIEIFKTTETSKNKFISMLLHFIRTPLTEIRWGLKSFMDSTEDDKNKKLAERLYNEELRTLEAIEHLLEVSRASGGRITYNTETVSLKNFIDLLKEEAGIASRIAKNKNISLGMEFKSPSDNFIHIDKEKIIIVAKTLLENAITYTLDGGNIVVRGKEDGKNFIFSVSDTGIGVMEKNKSDLFKQFHRLENAIRMNPKGFGVGLFMAKEFINYHKGDIWFESKENKGSTFFCSIPIIFSRTEAFFVTTKQ